MEADLKILEDAEKLSKQINFAKSIKADTILLELQGSIGKLEESFTDLSNKMNKLDEELTLVKKKVDASKTAQELLKKKNNETREIVG